MRKHRYRGHVMVAATLFAATACGAGDDSRDTATASGSLTTGAADPVMVAEFVHSVDQHEIQAAQLAQTKATNTQVRDYARTMITDHCRSLSMSTSPGAAGADTATPPAGANTMGTGNAACDRALASMGDMSSPDTGAAATAQTGADIQAMHQQSMTALRAAPQGARFDSTFMAAMVNGHQTVLQRLEQMTGTGGSYTAGSAAPGATGTAGSGNPGAVGSSGTTQTAGSLNPADTTQTNLQNAITMVGATSSARRRFSAHFRRAAESVATRVRAGGIGHAHGAPRRRWNPHRQQRCPRPGVGRRCEGVRSRRGVRGASTHDRDGGRQAHAQGLRNRPRQL